MENEFLIHLNPVRRDQADFIIHAKCLTNTTGAAVRKLEQLWCKRISENVFQICCIPFFVYNVALGDEVETSAEWEMQYVMQRVIKPSGHYTFRAWFGNSSEPNIQPQVLKELHELGCLMEYYSTNLLGIDAATDNQAQEVANLLLYHQQLGHLIFETGRTE